MDICWQLRQNQEEERAGREEATAAYMKLQDIIVAVRTDLEEAQDAADRYTLCHSKVHPLTAVL